MPKYFGTDGIRGEANGSVLTPDLIIRIAQATAQIMGQKSPHNRPTVVIGKDTRLSGYMIESALEAGFTSVGFYCLLVGPLPTPAVAMLTRSLRADIGVMITASHNPFVDNGIKIFDANGIKIGHNKVQEIEDLIDTPENINLAASDKIGKAVRIEDAVGRYMESCKTSVPKDFYLRDKRIVVDCANGAAYKIAPKVFWELGAQVIRMGVDPDGYNINRNVGATAPEAMCRAVQSHGASMGIALDGDADRLIMCDENGHVIDGDHILAAIALDMKAKGTLTHNTVVSTIMANMGLDNFLAENGIKLIRTPVGDHNVECEMRENDYMLGGEPSGHLIFRDFANTGDGILAALQVAAYLQEKGQPASSLRQFFTPFPMELTNIKLPDGVNAQAVVDSKKLQAAVEKANTDLGNTGRVFIRKSGTEPLIRITVEAETEDAVATYTKQLSDLVEAEV